MSNTPSGFPQGPYNPYNAPLPSQPAMPMIGAATLPTFCKTVFIIDLVLCVLRGLLVLVGVVGIMVLKQQQSPLYKTALLELCFNFLIFAAGLPANIGMLMKQSWGVVLAYVAGLATLASVGVGCYHLPLVMEKFPDGSPERVGAYIGAGVTCLIRVALAGLLVAAAMKFSAWNSARQDMLFRQQM